METNNFRNNSAQMMPSNKADSPAGIGSMFMDFNHFFNAMDRGRANHLSEKEDYYVTTIDMPGVKTDDIKIEIDFNILNIEASRETENGSRSYNTSFLLPNNVDENAQMKATYEDGVLMIALPKLKRSDKKSIKLESDEGGFFKNLMSSKKSNKVDVKN